MLFQIYGKFSEYQLIGFLLVFLGLILCNEIARRTKAGGVFFFFVLPVVLTVYFVAIAVGAANGSEWALNNQTHVYMDGWFHYAKLYAATIGCIGFMMIKYGWGIGKKDWFKPFPFIIVAINILIAVGSDFESAIRGANAAGGWWFSNEGVWLNGGWWNWVNGIAGIINIFCMTGWWGIYRSKKKDDMLWPDMTWQFIVAYDIWNFAYTYNNLPTHSWYCGVALLLAPTFAAALWNKGGWIQNRANTLAIWCMFAQVFPLFQIGTNFAVLPTLYQGAQELGLNALDLTKVSDITTTGIVANTVPQGVISILALVVNVVCLCAIIKRAKKLNINPYKQEVWKGTKDFEEAMERAE
ncbi:MAG: DUF5692 family protein [Agathobacter sp.]|nr:DUF5692 family protein [Agathobacter sp.]